MTARIDRVDRTTASHLIFDEFSHVVEDEKQILAAAARASDPVWVGYDKGELLCMYGLTAPTFLSDYAYLWLHTTPKMKAHSFVFIRHSQRAVAEMLSYYPRIIGHGTPGDDRSLAWLRLLGAKFGAINDDGLLPFEIKDHARG